MHFPLLLSAGERRVAAEGFLSSLRQGALGQTSVGEGEERVRVAETL